MGWPPAFLARLLAEHVVLPVPLQSEKKVKGEGKGQIGGEKGVRAIALAVLSPVLLLWLVHIPIAYIALGV